ncbi:DUF6635 family protein [Paracoccus sp. JM45]|uniref:DUF6635 family protein n=1 Tax=Paracoccus sp. JM45 TaxID=2283626 RepID=UPI000E6BC06E|nr:DUF6635 family protein [Paracoccus sp. JM45]RJE80572.1 hypothetical protein DWB67_06830 [Paracoccus sp. JM45]
MHPAPMRSRQTRRDAELGRFVRRRFGLRGTLALHRHAFGADLLRAPLNVMLAPVALILQLIAALLGKCGAKRLAARISGLRIFLASDMSARIHRDLSDLVAGLQAQGLGPDATPERIKETLRLHVEARNAVAEITTSLIVLVSGFILFQRATPGLISLAGPMAQMRAHGAAVRDFAMGETLGRAWYWAFPVELSPLYVVATGVVLALMGSIVTTFAGVIADPVQLLTGIHKRRLSRLMTRLDQQNDNAVPAPEHLLARLGDISETLAIVWRSWRN